MKTFEIEAADELQELADQIKRVGAGENGSFEINLASLTDDRKKLLRDELSTNLGASETAIYSISLPDADPAVVHEALTAARDDKLDQRCYSRVLPLPHHPTAVLYVGSSRDLRKRLMEHLGYGAKKTYSLHLRFWAAEFGKLRIDVRFYAPTTEKTVLCALEDHLAAKLVPLFGRRGSV